MKIRCYEVLFGIWRANLFINQDGNILDKYGDVSYNKITESELDRLLDDGYLKLFKEGNESDFYFVEKCELFNP